MPRYRWQPEFAASGLLRGRIEKGEPAHVYASADLGHPGNLENAGRARSKRCRFRAQPAVCIGAPGPESDDRRATRNVAGRKCPCRHVDAEGRSCRRLCFRAFRQGGSAKSRAPRPRSRPRRCSSPAGRPPRRRRRARTSMRWVMSRREGRCVSHLLHECRARARRMSPALADRGNPAGAECRRRVRDDRAQRCAGTGSTCLPSFILGEEGQAVLARHGFGRGDPPRM